MNNSSNSFYALGIDFGTNSVRALVMNLTNGEEVTSSVSNYKSGNNGILLDENATDSVVSNCWVSGNLVQSKWANGGGVLVFGDDFRVCHSRRSS